MVFFMHLFLWQHFLQLVCDCVSNFVSRLYLLLIRVANYHFVVVYQLRCIVAYCCISYRYVV